MDRGGAAAAGDGRGQGKALGADLHAVLRIAADLDAALGRQGIEPLAGIHGADRIDVEEIDLGDGVCPR